MTTTVRSDEVQKKLELMVPFLQKLVEAKYFTQDEVKKIIQKRREFELKIRGFSARVDDYMKYLLWEMNLDQLRTKRARLYEIARPVDLFFARQSKSYIRRLFEQALFKFKFSVELWKKYLTFCMAADVQFVSDVFIRAIKLNPMNSELWILAANWELERNRNVNVARTLLQRALRFLPKSKALWLEYFRLELWYTMQIRAKVFNKIKATFEHSIHPAALPEPTEENTKKNKATTSNDDANNNNNNNDDDDDDVDQPVMTPEQKEAERMKRIPEPLQNLFRGQLPLVVFSSAIHGPLSSDFNLRFEFLDIAAEFPHTQDIQNAILEQTIYEFSSNFNGAQQQQQQQQQQREECVAKCLTYKLTRGIQGAVDRVRQKELAAREPVTKTQKLRRERQKQQQQQQAEAEAEEAEGDTCYRVRDTFYRNLEYIQGIEQETFDAFDRAIINLPTARMYQCYAQLCLDMIAEYRRHIQEIQAEADADDDDDEEAQEEKKEKEEAEGSDNEKAKKAAAIAAACKQLEAHIAMLTHGRLVGTVYKPALEQQRMTSRMYHDYVNVLLAQKEEEEALRVARLGVKHFPANSELWLLLLRILTTTTTTTSSSANNSNKEEEEINRVIQDAIASVTPASLIVGSPSSHIPEKKDMYTRHKLNLWKGILEYSMQQQQQQQQQQRQQQHRQRQRQQHQQTKDLFHKAILNTAADVFSASTTVLPANQWSPAEIKKQYIEWTMRTFGSGSNADDADDADADGHKRVQQAYEYVLSMPPTTLDLYNMIIKIEKDNLLQKQQKANNNNNNNNNSDINATKLKIKHLYELAIDAYGSTNKDIWSSYMEFLESIGEHEQSGRLFWKAYKRLEYANELMARDALAEELQHKRDKKKKRLREDDGDEVEEDAISSSDSDEDDFDEHDAVIAQLEQKEMEHQRANEEYIRKRREHDEQQAKIARKHGRKTRQQEREEAQQQATEPLFVVDTNKKKKNSTNNNNNNNGKQQNNNNDNKNNNNNKKKKNKKKVARLGSTE